MTLRLRVLTAAVGAVSVAALAVRPAAETTITKPEDVGSRRSGWRASPRR
jgi:hypothetical protein